MKYLRELVKQWAEEVYTKLKQTTSQSCILHYADIESFDPNEDTIQAVADYLWEQERVYDELQGLDFDNENQRIVALWYEPPQERRN